MKRFSDRYGRIIRAVRISITDRCNLNCIYCMPIKNTVFLPKEKIMSYEEITWIVELLAEFGVSKVRISGGEPLIRKDVQQLIKKISRISGIKDIALTTNGTLLTPKLASTLYEFGLRRINISLDSLNPTTYQLITRGGNLSDALKGVQNARKAGFDPIKINTVLIRGINDQEIMDLFEYAKTNDLILRFIEEMPFVSDKASTGVLNDVLMDQLGAFLDLSHPFEKKPGYSGPAVTYPIRGSNGAIGFISPISHPFCDSCDRIRISTCGRLLPCISRVEGVDLLPLMRSGIPKSEIISVIRKTIFNRKYSHNGFTETIKMNRVGG